MYDTNTTYYIPSSYIKTENASKSPYGDFVEDAAYVVVTYDGTGYKYYWISVDDAGQGVKGIISYDKLDTDDIVSDIDPNEIKEIVEHTGVGSREYVQILKENGTWNEPHMADNHVGEEGSISGGSGGTTSNIVCRKATTLHTATCNRSDSIGCGATIGNGNTITYGTLVSGSPKAGDAYDCKVTQDGDYTERFYYVGSEGNNSILIYYTNMNDQTTYAYDSNQNWHGPRTGYQYLPSTSEWDNPGLIAPGTRQIVAQNGATSTSGGTIESFTYTDKAARFLTAQEVNSACGITVGSYITGELDGCIWLMENVGQYETSSESYGYWLETPRSSGTSHVWVVIGRGRSVYYSNVDGASSFGVRPVITVKTSDLE